MMARTVMIARLAWRNLWRNRRRTSIMLAAVVLGVWAMIFMTALMRGMVDTMVEDGLAALPGHVQIHHPAFRDDPSIVHTIAPPSPELSEALSNPLVVRWSTRVKVPAVIASEYDTRGVQLVGIDPERERGLSFVAEDITRGRYLTGADDAGIVLGREMLQRLETDLGKRVVVMTQDPDNEIADRGFRVVGVFDAELPALEETYAFVGISTLQKLLGLGDRVSEIAVMGADYRRTDLLLQHVVAAANPETEVLPWSESDAYLGAMLAVMDGFFWVWIVVIFIALSFGLVNTLVMAVFERVREIGLMLALGMTPKDILGQILLESVLLLSIGLAIGNLLGWMTIVPLESGIDISAVAEGMATMGAGSVLYPSLRAGDVFIADVIVIVLGFLASLSPAWRAAHYEPVEAIARVDS